MLEAAYQLVILGADDRWAQAVADRCRRAVVELVEDERLVAIERAVPPAGDPAHAPPHTLVVFLAEQRSREDPDLLAQVAAAREQLLPVLPVVRAGADTYALLPQLLRHLHALPWERDGSHVAGHVLRLLGLAEADRRLFLSYRRHETSGLALQLREHLSRRAFDVFLDRFSVPPAADFQRRIDVELADKAFVLLLESPTAVGSRWVQHEVAYALSHGISLLALSLPETTAGGRFPSVDEAFRMRLDAGELEPADEPVGADDRILTAAALERVLDAIESRYARQLRRRRTALLGSLVRWFGQAGVEPRPLSDEWALAADRPGGAAGVFLVTPRAPTPACLRKLDGLRTSHPAADGAPVEGHLVFAAPVQDAEDEQLIAWIADRRPLFTHSHLAVPDLLGLR